MHTRLKKVVLNNNLKVIGKNSSPHQLLVNCQPTDDRQATDRLLAVNQWKEGSH